MPKHRDAGSLSIREREARLLSWEQFEGIIGSQTDQELAERLEEYGWDSLDPKDFAGAAREIQSREAAILETLTAYASAAKMLHIFRIPYDYHNAKVLLKAEAAGTDGRHLLSSGGRVDPGCFAEQDASALPPVLSKAMQEAKALLARAKDAQAADILLDQAMYREYLELAKGWKSKFFKGYVRLLIDAANLTTTVRAQRMDLSRGRFTDALIPGGGISPARIAEALANSGLAALYASTYLEEAAASALPAMETGSFMAFACLVDKAVMTYLKSGRRVPFGPAPVIAYMAAVVLEGQALRVILASRRAKLPAESVRERLRDCYV